MCCGPHARKAGRAKQPKVAAVLPHARMIRHGCCAVLCAHIRDPRSGPACADFVPRNARWKAGIAVSPWRGPWLLLPAACCLLSAEKRVPPACCCAHTCCLLLLRDLKLACLSSQGLRSYCEVTGAYIRNVFVWQAQGKGVVYKCVFLRKAHLPLVCQRQPVDFCTASSPSSPQAPPRPTAPSL